MARLRMSGIVRAEPGDPGRPGRPPRLRRGRLEMDTVVSLSNALAASVEAVARSVVAVHARRRLPSSGIHWRPGIVVTAEHTVRIEEEIRVTGSDGRVAPARLLARDPG